MWAKIKSGRVHLRTRQSVGAGGSGHGREYPAYLQALRDIEDQDRPSNSRESKETKIKLLGIEEVEDTVAMREAIKVETENEWTGRIKGERPMTALLPNQVDQSLSSVSSDYKNLHEVFGNVENIINRTVGFASLRHERVSPYLVVTILQSFAEAKAAIRPEISSSHEEVILWAAIAHGLFNEKEDKGLPRVNKALEDAIANVGVKMNDEIKAV